MSNLRPFRDHCKVQDRSFRGELAGWWHERTLQQRFVDVALSPFLVSVIFILCATYFNAIMSVYQDQRYAPGHTQPLSDTLYDVLPFWDSRTAPNLMLYPLVAFTVVRFLPQWNGMSMRKSGALYKRLILLEGLVQVVRGLALGTTAPPPPDPKCDKVAFGSIWREGLHLIDGSKHTCGDLVLSGHTGFYTLLALFWSFYSQGEEFNFLLPRRWWASDVTVPETVGQQGTVMTRPTSPGPANSPRGAQQYEGVGRDERLDPAVSFGSPSPLNWPPARHTYHLIDFVMWGLIIMASLVLIWTRYHYTSDVFLGFLVAQGLFRVYHLALTSLEWKLRHFDCAHGRHLREEAPGLTRFTVPERFLLWFESPVLFRPHRPLHEPVCSTGPAAAVARSASSTKDGQPSQLTAELEREAPVKFHKPNDGHVGDPTADVEMGKKEYDLREYEKERV